MLRHGHEFRKRAVLPVFFAGNPQHPSMVAEIDLSAPAKLTLAAVDGGIKGDAVPGSPALYLAPGRGDNTGSFVPHDDGRPAPARASIHPVHVAAANAARLHRDQYLLRPGFRRRRLFKYESFVF